MEDKLQKETKKEIKTRMRSEKKYLGERDDLR